MCQIDYNAICTKCGKFQCGCGSKVWDFYQDPSYCQMCGKKNTLLEPCGCGFHKGFGDTQIITPLDFEPKCPHCRKRHSAVTICQEHPVSKVIADLDKEIKEEEASPKKDPCPGRSQSKCEYCGECHGLFTICDKNPNYQEGFTGPSTMDPLDLYPTLYPPHLAPGVITTGTTSVEEPTSSDLEDLYDELGKCNWLGADAGWDRAIDTVRAHIKEKLGK